MEKCTASGCGNAVSKPGFKLCLKCWKEQRAGRQAQQNGGGQNKAQTQQHLTATDIGKHFGLKAPRINLLLSELGWIARGAKGWNATSVGEAMGAKIRHIAQTGVPFAVWNPSVLTNKILMEAVGEYRGDNAPAAQNIDAKAAAAPSSGDFRGKFPAGFRATDGHFVRSKAEMLIDNYLYAAGIVHAYERKLPVEEDVYCDFYLPEKKVYIEYWGLENDPAYRNRKEKKLAVYEKYAFNLIQLHEEEVQNLDDHMPRLLLAFGITVD